MNVRIFGDERLFSLGPFSITDTMVSSLVVSAALVVVALWLRHCVTRRPRSLPATLAKLTVRWLDQSTREIIGRPAPAVSSLAGSLFLFIAACNLSGQLPHVHPATASLATTSALAVIVFLAVPFAGMMTHGPGGYLKHYFSPNPIMFPLHIVSEISRTVALAMRLFGNIMSGHLVVGLLVALAGFLAPMPFMALDVLIGLLQAYIFAILATVFVGAAIGVGEKS